GFAPRNHRSQTARTAASPSTPAAPSTPARRRLRRAGAGAGSSAVFVGLAVPAGGVGRPGTRRAIGGGGAAGGGGGVGGKGPSLAAMAWRASTTAEADGGRSAGFLPSKDITSADSSAGMAGLTRWSGRGSRRAVATRTAKAEPPVNGCTPVAYSYRTQPRLNRSQRGSTASAASACSGAM